MTVNLSTIEHREKWRRHFPCAHLAEKLYNQCRFLLEKSEEAKLYKSYGIERSSLIYLQYKLHYCSPTLQSNGTRSLYKGTKLMILY